MAVTKAEVLRIAALARLAVNDDDAERFTVQLNDILSHVEALRAAEASGVEKVDRAPQREPLLGPAAPPRADEPSADHLAVLPAAFAPEWVDGFFVVPRLAALDADALPEGGGSRG